MGHVGDAVVTPGVVIMDDSQEALPALDRWSIALAEPDPLPLEVISEEMDTPDILRLPSEWEPYPSEGYQPRLNRFREAG